VAAVGTVNICTVCIAVLTLPFIMQAFTTFAGGVWDIWPLLKGSFRMGALLYVKYLAIGAVSFGFAYL